MKKLTALIAFLPTTTLAHGMHAPVDPALHSFAHVMPAVIIIALAAALALYWRMRQ